MKYYLIAGEASGDLHASNLMKELKVCDPEAEFRFYGGDMMQAVGGTLVKHYRELAYMGFIPVLMHLPTILKNMSRCKSDIRDWKPDVLILVDYPGFNLSIAEYIHKHKLCKVYYYISPKIWAWKEYRIKNIRRDVDELFSILPFEQEWFAQRHYPIHYVGNPCVDAVHDYLINSNHTLSANSCESGKTKTIAILAGSRKQEIKDNLKTMLDAASSFLGYKLVVAGAPGIDESYYHRFIPDGIDVEIRFGETYQILHDADAALVTSGTATLETAILRIPQVVCYYIACGKLVSWLRKRFLKVKYISLVNLIANSEVVPELVADAMTEANIVSHLKEILPGGSARQSMLRGYDFVNQRLGGPGASRVAASKMVELLQSS